MMLREERAMEFLVPYDYLILMHARGWALGAGGRVGIRNATYANETQVMLNDCKAQK